MSFHDDLWAAAEPVYERILAHPFLTELTSGQLDRARFRHYLIQDIHYIDGFVRILALLASQTPRRADVAMLCGRAGEVAAEHDLHAGLQADLGVTDQQVAETPPGPTTRAYLDFLTASVHDGDLLEGICAVLACPWIYRRVGRQLIDDGSPDPHYDRWIRRYGADEATVLVQPLLELADRVADQAGPPARQRATDRFVTACRYEWMFWDAGYHHRGWPV